MNTYATDGKCHNAEPGTYNHECGKPATWLGTKKSGFTSGFCNECKQHGYEAKACIKMMKLTKPMTVLVSDFETALDYAVGEAVAAGTDQSIMADILSNSAKQLRDFIFDENLSVIYRRVNYRRVNYGSIAPATAARNEED